jgi:hypothetical protein
MRESTGGSVNPRRIARAAPVAALVPLVLAGLALLKKSSVFQIFKNGKFGLWMFWAIVMLTFAADFELVLRIRERAGLQRRRSGGHPGRRLDFDFLPRRFPWSEAAGRFRQIVKCARIWHTVSSVPLLNASVSGTPSAGAASPAAAFAPRWGLPLARTVRVIRQPAGVAIDVPVFCDVQTRGHIAPAHPVT